MSQEKLTRHFLVFLLGVALSGCASFSDIAHRTKGTLAVGALVAVETWQEFDLAKQRGILDGSLTREAYEQRIAAYRAGEQAKAVKAIKTARHAFAALSGALKAYDAGTGDKRDVGKALAAALTAAGELVAALQSAGVKVDAGFLTGDK